MTTPTPSSNIKNEWYSKKISEVLTELNTSERGLSKEQALRRLSKYGQNVLPEEKGLSDFRLLVNQFKSAFVYILLIAVVMSFLLGETTDGAVIVLAVVINVVVGFVQERKAQKALLALKRVIEGTARVVRSGSVRVIPAKELVPGDIVILQSGDKVPADMRVLDVTDLHIAEASLTGESRPIRKNTEPIAQEDVGIGDRANMAFMGTVVTQGSGVGVVVSTGAKTAIGHIAQLVKNTESAPTPLQIKLDVFGKRLAIIVLLLSALVFAVGKYSGFSTGEMFTTSVAIAVAAIPEGLVVTLTVILAIGMRRILNKHGLVKQLVAAETLGSTSVICTDKTGTLTMGEMRVVNIVTEDGELDEKSIEGMSNLSSGSPTHSLIVRGMVLCNNAVFIDAKQEEINGNPTDRALLKAGILSGLDKGVVDDENERYDEIPFDSNRKYMMTMHKWSEEHNIVYIKGASERVLGRVNCVATSGGDGSLPSVTRLGVEDINKKRKQFEEMSSRGLRVIAMAYMLVPSSTRRIADIENSDEFVLLGFIGFQDPLRPDVRDVIEESKRAGVSTVMITGDHMLTARSIAKDLGLSYGDDNIITGKELRELSQEELRQRVSNISVYARVSPEDKLKIVQAWQENGHVVAMTGDGVNDAPALKKADIGVAVGSGTDVAKETADLILLDDNFTTIVSAIRQGRVIYDNIRKVILYFISDSFTEMVIIISGLLMGWPLPVLASQILWVNLVDDTLPSLALTQEPEEKEIMSEPPEKKNKPILDIERKLLIGLISAVAGIGTLILFWYYWQGEADNITYARSVAFGALGIKSLLYVLSVRSIRHPIWKTKIYANPSLLIAIGIGIVAQVSAMYVPFLQKILQTVPLKLADWGMIVLMSISVMVIIELVKAIFIKINKTRQLA